eukprot:g744.t1
MRTRNRLLLYGTAATCVGAGVAVCVESNAVIKTMLRNALGLGKRKDASSRLLSVGAGCVAVGAFLCVAAIFDGRTRSHAEDDCDAHMFSLDDNIGELPSEAPKTSEALVSTAAHRKPSAQRKSVAEMKIASDRRHSAASTSPASEIEDSANYDGECVESNASHPDAASMFSPSPRTRKARQNGRMLPETVSESSQLTANVRKTLQFHKENETNNVAEGKREEMSKSNRVDTDAQLQTAVDENEDCRAASDSKEEEDAIETSPISVRIKSKMDDLKRLDKMRIDAKLREIGDIVNRKLGRSCDLVVVDLAGRAVRLTKAIKFVKNTVIVKKESRKVLEQAAIALRTVHEVIAKSGSSFGVQQICFECAGHTHAKTTDLASSELHLRVSQERADAVRDFLVREGCNADCLFAKGYGGTCPIGRPSMNRRVELVVMENSAMFIIVHSLTDGWMDHVFDIGLDAQKNRPFMVFFLLAPLPLAIAGGVSMVSAVSVYTVCGCCYANQLQSPAYERLENEHDGRGKERGTKKLRRRRSSAERGRLRKESFVHVKDIDFTILAANFCRNFSCYKRGPVSLPSETVGKQFFRAKRSGEKGGSGKGDDRDKWCPAPHLSSYSDTASDPLICFLVKPESCTMPLKNAAFRRDFSQLLLAFNAHRSFLPIELVDFPTHEADIIATVRPITKLGSVRDCIYQCERPLAAASSEKWNKNEARPLHERDVRAYGYDVLLGLIELRSHGIVCDRLSASNVIVDSDGRAAISGIEQVLLGSPVQENVRAFLSRIPQEIAVDVALFGRFVYEMATGDELMDDMIDFVGAPAPSALLLDLMCNIFPWVGKPQHKVGGDKRSQRSTSSPSSGTKFDAADVDDWKQHVSTDGEPYWRSDKADLTVFTDPSACVRSLNPFDLLKHPFFADCVVDSDGNRVNPKYVQVLDFNVSDTSKRTLKMYRAHAGYRHLQRGVRRSRPQRSSDEKQMRMVRKMFGRSKQKKRMRKRGGGDKENRKKTKTKETKKQEVSRPPNEGSRIRVIARCRPQISEDLEHCIGDDEPSECVRVLTTKSLSVSRLYYEDRNFTFDAVLGPTATQEKTYAVLGRGAVEEVMRGFNGTVMAYGQTGSGKTFTVFGSSTFWRKFETSKCAHLRPKDYTTWSEWETAGLLPRAFVDISKSIDRKRRKGVSVSLRFSALQIYREQLLDMLAERSAEQSKPAFDLSGANAEKRNCEDDVTSLSIRESKKDGVYVEGLRWKQVSSLNDLFELTARINKRRNTRHTLQNRTSSRSHCLIQIAVEQHLSSPSDKAPGGSKSTDAKHRVRRSLLRILDLAGSERVSKSGSNGERLREAIKINQSISALGNCVAALAAKSCQGNVSTRRHVPFRDSKLTRLLTNTLGSDANSQVTLCTNVAPIAGHCDETLSTLAFASRAMRVSVRASINEDVEATKNDANVCPDRCVSCDLLRRENKALRAEIETLRAERHQCPADVLAPKQVRSKLWDELIERNAELEIANVRQAVALEAATKRTVKTSATTNTDGVEQLRHALRLEQEKSKRLRTVLQQVSAGGDEKERKTQSAFEAEGGGGRGEGSGRERAGAEESKDSNHIQTGPAKSVSSGKARKAPGFSLNLKAKSQFPVECGKRQYQLQFAAYGNSEKPLKMELTEDSIPKEYFRQEADGSTLCVLDKFYFCDSKGRPVRVDEAFDVEEDGRGDPLHREDRSSHIDASSFFSNNSNGIKNSFESVRMANVQAFATVVHPEDLLYAAADDEIQTPKDASARIRLQEKRRKSQRRIRIWISRVKDWCIDYSANPSMWIVSTSGVWYKILTLRSGRSFIPEPSLPYDRYFDTARSKFECCIFVWEALVALSMSGMRHIPAFKTIVDEAANRARGRGQMKLDEKILLLHHKFVAKQLEDITCVGRGEKMKRKFLEVLARRGTKRDAKRRKHPTTPVRGGALRAGGDYTGISSPTSSRVSSNESSLIEDTLLLNIQRLAGEPSVEVEAPPPFCNDHFVFLRPSIVCRCLGVWSFLNTFREIVRLSPFPLDSLQVALKMPSTLPNPLLTEIFMALVKFLLMDDEWTISAVRAGGGEGGIDDDDDATLDISAAISLSDLLWSFAGPDQSIRDLYGRRKRVVDGAKAFVCDARFQDEPRRSPTISLLNASTLHRYLLCLLSTCESVGGFREQAERALLSRCAAILEDLMALDISEPFRDPVRIEDVPDYFDFIDRPMDLGTIRDRLRHGAYYDDGSDRGRAEMSASATSWERFRDDIQLVWDNCYTFNQRDSLISVHAAELESLFKQSYAALVADPVRLWRERSDVRASILSREERTDNSVESEIRRRAKDLVEIARHLQEIGAGSANELRALPAELKLTTLEWLCDAAASTSAVRSALDSEDRSDDHFDDPIPSKRCARSDVSLLGRDRHHSCYRWFPDDESGRVWVQSNANGSIIGVFRDTRGVESLLHSLNIRGLREYALSERLQRSIPQIVSAQDRWSETYGDRRFMLEGPNEMLRARTFDGQLVELFGSEEIQRSVVGFAARTARACALTCLNLAERRTIPALIRPFVVCTTSSLLESSSQRSDAAVECAQKKLTMLLETLAIIVGSEALVAAVGAATEYIRSHPEPSTEETQKLNRLLFAKDNTSVHDGAERKASNVVEERLYEVTCPEGVTSGQTIRVRLGGELDDVKVSVPPGIVAGQNFRVKTSVSSESERKGKNGDPPKRRSVEHLIRDSITDSPASKERDGSSLNARYVEKTTCRRLQGVFSETCVHCGATRASSWHQCPSRCLAFRLCHECGVYLSKHCSHRSIDVAFAYGAQLKLLATLREIGGLATRLHWLHVYVRSDAAIQGDDGSEGVTNRVTRYRRAMLRRASLFSNAMAVVGRASRSSHKQRRSARVTRADMRQIVVLSLRRLDAHLASHPAALASFWASHPAKRDALKRKIDLATTPSNPCDVRALANALIELESALWTHAQSKSHDDRMRTFHDDGLIRKDWSNARARWILAVRRVRSLVELYFLTEHFRRQGLELLAIGAVSDTSIDFRSWLKLYIGKPNHRSQIFSVGQSLALYVAGYKEALLRDAGPRLLVRCPRVAAYASSPPSLNVTAHDADTVSILEQKRDINGALPQWLRVAEATITRGAAPRPLTSDVDESLQWCTVERVTYHSGSYRSVPRDYKGRDGPFCCLRLLTRDGIVFDLVLRLYNAGRHFLLSREQYADALNVYESLELDTSMHMYFGSFRSNAENPDGRRLYQKGLYFSGRPRSRVRLRSDGSLPWRSIGVEWDEKPGTVDRINPWEIIPGLRAKRGPKPKAKP